MTLLPNFTSEGLTAEQRAMWDEVTQGPRGFSTGGASAPHLPGLYNAWLPFPEFGLLMMQLGDAIRKHGDIPGKLREMVVITTSALLKSQLELDVHSIFARVEGLSEDVIDAIHKGVQPVFTDEAEATVYEANVELVKTGTLSEELRQKMIDQIGLPGLTQFISLVGLYTIVSYTINIHRIELDPDYKLDETELKQFLENARG